MLYVKPFYQWPGVDLGQYQVVVLANVERVTAAQTRALEQFVYGGGGVLVAPGNLARIDNYNQVLFREGAGLLPAALMPPTPPDGSHATALLGYNPHPVFRFLRGQPDPLPSATIGRYFPTEAAAGGAASSSGGAGRGATGSAGPLQRGVDVLARYASGQPFLIESKLGAGRVLLVTTPLDADWSTLPLSNFYLPFVQSAVRYLAGGTVQDRNLALGRPIEVTFPDPADDLTVTLTRPGRGGDPVPLNVVRFGGRQAEVRYDGADEPGEYRVRVKEAGRERTLHFVVRAPAEESDLTPLTGDQWQWLEQGLGFRRIDGERQPIPAAVARARGGRELWAVALVAVLVLGLVEIAVARGWSAEERDE